MEYEVARISTLAVLSAAIPVCFESLTESLTIPEVVLPVGCQKVVDRLTHSRSRGFGFITFDDVEVCAHALNTGCV